MAKLRAARPRGLAMSFGRSLHRRLPARRAWLKSLHLAMIPLFAWFMVMQPDDVVPMGELAWDIHSKLALVFVSMVLFWYADYLRRGLAGRPGPKLGPRARAFHRGLHRTMIWGLFLVALSGFGLGLTSATLLKAGDILPVAPPLDMPRLNALIGWFHTVEFYALGGVVLVHAGFHVWRHVRLRDNALRIMAPRALHRFL